MYWRVPLIPDVNDLAYGVISVPVHASNQERGVLSRSTVGVLLLLTADQEPRRR